MLDLCVFPTRCRSTSSPGSTKVRPSLPPYLILFFTASLLLLLTHARFAIWRINHQDFVSVFPSGNEGANNLFYSIASPAVSKNCIAVGATLNYDESGSSVYVASGITKLKVEGGAYFTAIQTDAFTTVEAEFGGEAAYTGIQGSTLELVAANPIGACR